jgi:hypothetical protein
MVSSVARRARMVMMDACFAILLLRKKKISFAYT